MEGTYLIPPGVHSIPQVQLDLRPDADIDHDLLHPLPPSDSEKNIWFFWHSGYANLHGLGKRNIRAWHRRFSKLGWIVRVVDRQPGSALNIAHFFNVHDRAWFPRAFAEDAITGPYARQHTSDLVRFPLVLRYGGVYADVGFMQIGDLDRLWSQTVGDPESPWDVLSYDGDAREPRYHTLTNYFLAAGRGNPLFDRCHRLLLALWAEDGGKTSTEGLHASKLLQGTPLIGTTVSFEENGRVYGPDECAPMLSDYILQGQAITTAMNLVDKADGWDGPAYCAAHVYAVEFMVGAQLINEFTGWDGALAYRLMTLPMPREGEPESSDQKRAREIVEAILARSFGFKLATGIILRMVGETLGNLWKKNDGSDDIPGTYGYWLRHGMIYWTQDDVPKPVDLGKTEPLRRGRLLGDD